MNIQIFLNDGSTMKAFVKDYNAGEFAVKMNDHRILMVAIGDVILNKNMIKLITPVQNAAE
ncbi:hypothetical protein [Bacillus sp. Hm123]|uniref:hypothetical protein n=1 Tax=Bacillus sp. Hm123 TaxID=3450745 RepID=UPI003F423F96